MKKFSALILAGGSSERFGGNKLLMPFGDETVLQKVLANFERGFSEVIVVAGKYFDDLKSTVSNEAITWVRNERFAEGMSSSVKLGFEAANPCDAIFVTPADLPLFTSKTIDAMIVQYENGSIVIPQFQGKKGHPVALDWRFRTEILTLQSDKLLYDVIQKNQNAIRLVATEDPGILMDIDTREDYEELLTKIRRPVK